MPIPRFVAKVLLLGMVGCGARGDRPDAVPRDDGATRREVAPTPISLLRGTVTDGDGNAVVGAAVIVAPMFDGTGQGPTARTVFSGASGEFSFPSLEAGSYTVTASSKTNVGLFDGEVVVEKEKPRDVAIVLRPAATTLRGTVRDLEGAPVEGATVEALDPFGFPAIFATKTDDAGRYEIPLAMAGYFIVFASTERHGRSMRRREPSGETDLVIAAREAPRPSNAELAVWLDKSAVPITTDAPGSGIADLAPITEVIGPARVIALGEATHGSAEFFRLKHRLLELLVERGDVTLLGIEAGYDECLAVDAFVRGGKGDAEAVVRSLVTDPWKTTELVELVRWMRRWNADPKHKKKIGVAGFDQTTWASVPAAIAFLERADATLAKELRAALAPIADITSDGTYPQATPEVKASTRAAALRLVRAIDENRVRLERATSKEAFRVARRHAEIIRQAEEVFRDPTSRDTYMAENVRTLLAGHPAGERIALWLHNVHASAAPPFFDDMGRRLRGALGRDYFVLGFAFGSGGLRALDGRDEKRGIELHEVKTADPRGFDAALAFAKRPMFFVDLRAAPTNVASWLDTPLVAWSVGFRFTGEENATLRIVPRRAFDAVIYVDHVTAAHGLP